MPGCVVGVALEGGESECMRKTRASSPFFFTRGQKSGMEKAAAVDSKS
jgi:hypothetical protein